MRFIKKKIIQIAYNNCIENGFFVSERAMCYGMNKAIAQLNLYNFLPKILRKTALAISRNIDLNETMIPNEIEYK